MSWVSRDGGGRRRSMSFRNPEKDDSAGSIQQASTRRSHVAEVYSEMFNLLEEYAPSWYSEDLHCRAAAGLKELETANSPLPQSGC